MSTDPKAGEALLFDEQTLSDIYQNKLNQENADTIYQFLCEDGQDDVDPFAALPGQQALELEEDESQFILQNILGAMQEEPAVVQSPAPAVVQKPSFWASLQELFRSPMYTLASAVTAVFLLMPVFITENEPAKHKDIQKDPIPVAQKTQKKETFTTKSCSGVSNKCRNSGAFLDIEIHRFAQGNFTKPVEIQNFEHGKRYALQQAMVFRFRVINPGYIYLFRQDESGKLEQLFPFSAKKATLFQQGISLLEHNGERVAYFLDKKLLGKQTLKLVHATSPQRFPKHVRELTSVQKQLFQNADQQSFEVVESLKRKENRATLKILDKKPFPK